MPRVPWCQVVAVLLWAGTSLGAEPSPERSRMELSPGSQRVFTLPPEVRGFSVRDEGVVEVRSIGSRQLLVMALDEGRTELVLHGPFGPVRRIDVRLVKRDACGFFICEPCGLLAKGHMLQMGGVEDVLVLRGIAWSLEEARSVKLLAARYPLVRIEVRLDRRALREGLLRVNHTLWRAGFLHARASVVDGRVSLSGRFASDADEARARAAIASEVVWMEELLGLPVVEAPGR
jgi:Pilus formation protein N terminal region